MLLKINSFNPSNKFQKDNTLSFGAKGRIEYPAGSYGMLQQNLEKELIKAIKQPAKKRVEKAALGLKIFGAHFDSICGWKPGTTVNNYFKRLGIDTQDITLNKIMEYITCGENKKKPLAKLLGRVQKSGLLD